MRNINQTAIKFLYLHRDRSERKRDKRDRSRSRDKDRERKRDKERKERKPEFDIKIKEEPVDGELKSFHKSSLQNHSKSRKQSLDILLWLLGLPSGRFC